MLDCTGRMPKVSEVDNSVPYEFKPVIQALGPDCGTSGTACLNGH